MLVLKGSIPGVEVDVGVVSSVVLGVVSGAISGVVSGTVSHFWIHVEFSFRVDIE